MKIKLEQWKKKKNKSLKIKEKVKTVEMEGKKDKERIIGRKEETTDVAKKLINI